MSDKWLSRLRPECKCVLRGSLSLIGTSYLYVSNCHVSVSPWPLNLLVPKSSDRTILPLFPPSSHTRPYLFFLPSCCDQVWLWLFDTCLQYFLSHPPWFKGHGKTSNDLICSSMEPSWLICLVSCWSSFHFKEMARSAHWGFTVLIWLITWPLVQARKCLKLGPFPFRNHPN